MISFVEQQGHFRVDAWDVTLDNFDSIYANSRLRPTAFGGGGVAVSTSQLMQAFEAIYRTDLVYAPDCWKRCGDAHCCNFSRYKSSMGITADKPFQELPLLPGEMQFLVETGFIRDFGEIEHRVIEFPLSRGVLRAEFLVSRGKTCACQHNTRTTVCRLYPLMPRFDDAGHLIGTDTMFGMFEHIERLDVLPRACKIDAIPFSETDKLLTICRAIGSNPLHVFIFEHLN